MLYLDLNLDMQEYIRTCYFPCMMHYFVLIKLIV